GRSPPETNGKRINRECHVEREARGLPRERGGHRGLLRTGERSRLRRQYLQRQGATRSARNASRVRRNRLGESVLPLRERRQRGAGGYRSRRRRGGAGLQGEAPVAREPDPAHAP